jgi:hypothetical protein
VLLIWLLQVTSLDAAARALLERGVSVSDASRQLARERGVPRKQAYSAALAARGS